MELNYEQDVKIDPNALDMEWLEQPELMRKYAKYAADCKYYVDETKEKLDVVKAGLDSDIRSQPEKYGFSKPTEGAIQNTIQLQKEYQDAVKEYNAAKYEQEAANAAVRAIDQRKTALENLVRLLSASYFAGPQTPRDINQEYKERLKENEKQQDQSKANSAVKMGRRKGSGK